jgi:NADPH:quinone reductase-like Zn-dependent oxidoreductase
VRTGVTALDLAEHGKDLADVVRGLTDGRGPDAVIDAVGMEAHGRRSARVAHQIAGSCPTASPRR